MTTLHEVYNKLSQNEIPLIKNWITLVTFANKNFINFVQVVGQRYISKYILKIQL